MIMICTFIMMMKTEHDRIGHDYNNDQEIDEYQKPN